MTTDDTYNGSGVGRATLRLKHRPAPRSPAAAAFLRGPRIGRRRRAHTKLVMETDPRRMTSGRDDGAAAGEAIRVGVALGGRDE
ncbi:unnamed protein product [Danaus chrysippus]|uniref:(African queen) hypothetical protein n=1 Tax=Danaus chrysippus TaxID=151541 RepID=A0A8J2QJF5_9NEOP|nr:unnamed protein product [Danaus chrysippus]